jgi:FolB domain-containing protein
MSSETEAFSDHINIEQLEIFARVGVTESERANPQRLTLTISVWPDKSFENLEDDITQTANYSAICAAACDFARERSVKLIETMADQLASHLLQIFPIRKVQVELRKFVLPDAKHVSVIVTRRASLS